MKVLDLNLDLCFTVQAQNDGNTGQFVRRLDSSGRVFALKVAVGRRVDGK